MKKRELTKGCLELPCSCMWSDLKACFSLWEHLKSELQQQASSSFSIMLADSDYIPLLEASESWKEKVLCGVSRPNMLPTRD